MIDWHCHVLPAMDDGSRDLEESIEMLDALKRQGIELAIATPHFYANEESVDTFLSRRNASRDLLASRTSSNDVRVLCGAEVRYYPGIGRMEGLERLAIEGTNLLLLEMPMAKWTDFTVRELAELASTRGLKIVMAHIERYLSLQDKKMIAQLCEAGILMQSNASFFDRMGTRQKAIKLLSSGYIHFVGSDCHNMAMRPPKIDLAYDYIQKKLGKEFSFQMIEYGYRSLGHKL